MKNIYWEDIKIKTISKVNNKEKKVKSNIWRSMTYVWKMWYTTRIVYLKWKILKENELDYVCEVIDNYIWYSKEKFIHYFRKDLITIT